MAHSLENLFARFYLVAKVRVSLEVGLLMAFSPRRLSQVTGELCIQSTRKLQPQARSTVFL